MKKIIAIVLLVSLLSSNVGIVRIGDSCCSKTISAMLQPILSANCCCISSTAANAKNEDACCAELNMFKKLNSDFEKFSAANVFEFKSDFAIKAYPDFSNNFLISTNKYVFFKQKYIAKPPGDSTVLLYKLFNKLILFG